MIFIVSGVYSFFFEERRRYIFEFFVILMREYYVRFIDVGIEGILELNS